MKKEAVEAFQIDFRFMENFGAHQKHATSTQEIVSLPESLKQDTRNAGRCNIRKSLAWNSAFFTSEGILDPEELATVNSTFRKVDSNVLPLIQEDLNKLSDSNSTLDTDGWGIDNCEAELFDNVRTSIQKSFSKPNEEKVLSRKFTSRPLATKRGIFSSTKAETFTNPMLKPPDSTKVISVSKHGSYGISKRDGERNGSKQPPRTSDSGGNGSKQPPRMSDSGGNRCKQPLRKDSRGNGSKQPSSSVKPPRMASKISPSQRVSTPVAKIKNTEKTVSGNCRREVSSKIYGSAVQSVVMPKSSSPSRLVPSPAFSKKLPNTPHSSYTKFGCTASDITTRNSQESSRKKLYSRSVATSFSNSRVYSHSISSISRQESRNIVHLHPYLKSSSKFSLHSPNSSFDSVVSPSSSSSTSVRTKKSQFSCARSSLDSITSIASGIAESRKHDGNNFDNMEFKPSGLRLPSPKIGYFDMEKSIIGNSNSGSKVGLHTPGTRANSESENVSDVIKQRSWSKPSPKENHDKIGSRYLGGQDYEKENLLSCELGRKSNSEEMKIVEIEQLEKRLTSLKMSLSEPSILERSGMLKSIFDGKHRRLFGKKANGQ